MSSSPSDRRELRRILEDCIQIFNTPYRYYRIAAHRFLAYLEANFPQLNRLSELRRDPHLLGWFHSLCNEDPSLSTHTRRIYLTALRRLLKDLAGEGHALESGLILPEDFPPRPPHFPRWARNKDYPWPPRPPKPSCAAPRPPAPLPHPVFGKVFEDLIQTLATTLQASTIVRYRNVSRHFLSYLQSDFPEVSQLSDLRRTPHMFGYFRRLCQKPPHLSAITRTMHLYSLRRMLHDFAAQGHDVQPGLILRQDFPQCPRYLPRALSPEHDQRLQEELRHSDNLLSNALLLTRATGIRIGECIDLAENCLRSVGPDQWALHVPLGKLHTERLVPVDADIRQIVTRILALRVQAPHFCLNRSIGLLLPRSASRNTFYQALSQALKTAGKRAGCPSVSCHQLRHTFATDMVRLGVSLPALMQLLGHKDIRMTMRYVQITQIDLQREFHSARHHAVHQLHIPQLPHLSATTSDLPGIQAAVAATRHLLEMFRRQLQDEKARHQAQRLDKRLLRVAQELDRLTITKK
jgi:site-specific recombinase XerD